MCPDEWSRDTAEATCADAVTNTIASNRSGSARTGGSVHTCRRCQYRVDGRRCCPSPKLARRGWRSLSGPCPRETMRSATLKPYWGKPAVRNFRGANGNGATEHAKRARSWKRPTQPSRLLRATAPWVYSTNPHARFERGSYSEHRARAVCTVGSTRARSRRPEGCTNPRFVTVRTVPTGRCHRAEA
jgi:hypothetical protein